MAIPTTNAVENYTRHPDVIDCISKLETRFGQGGANLQVSDVIDGDGHQYVNLVQKGGGVLGVALVGYTYVLEQMGIRFIRLAGTSAGAINTALMTVIGAQVENTPGADGKPQSVKGNKKMAKSEEILKVITELQFFSLVDGHPVARALIKQFITNQNFSVSIGKWLKGIIIALIALPSLDFIFLGVQHHYGWVSILTKFTFVLTGFYFMLLAILIIYTVFLIGRLKDSGFGINPGDYFYDWIKTRLKENHVNTVSDLISVASTPVEDLQLREDPTARPQGLNGDVTFITSEIVTKNKIEFPKMWTLFRQDIDGLQPAGFIRASMSIPIFFESFFINEIPCHDADIRNAWSILGEADPPTTARFVDGGILSNFPINLFYNPEIDMPRLPSFGIDLDDEKDAKEVFATTKPGPAANGVQEETDDEGKHAESWSIGGYLYRMFNTVRFYYDKDFLIKNTFFKKGIGVIPLKGYGWLNFFLTDEAKREMFVLGAKAATKFLLEDFNWNDYKQGRQEMQMNLKTVTPDFAPVTAGKY